MSTTQEPYEFHFDAGHEWLRVPKSIALGFEPSQYSYQSRDNWFLEGDCDASRFRDEFVSEYGRPPEYVEVDDGDNSPIRSMLRCGGSS